MSNPYQQLPPPTRQATMSAAHQFGSLTVVVQDRLEIKIGDKEIDLVRLLARVEFLEKLTEGYPRYCYD